jgi:predicted RNA-binding protein with PUA-like domain
MKYFLAKTDPETYSLEDFKKEKETNWDGVRSHQAVNVIKSWKIGDMVLIYHSLGESKIVGLAEVVGEPQKDLNDPKGISWHAKLKFVKEFDENKQITLKEIKQTELFKDFSLVKQSRLSTMECPDNFIEFLTQKKIL